MNAADRTFMDGFRVALAIAHATADRIATGSMPTLRREMAAEALRPFAAEASSALDIGIPISLRSQTSAQIFGQLAQVSQASGAATQNRAVIAIGLGYVGEACPDCANFTLVRNGTCPVCEACGTTSGCS